MTDKTPNNRITIRLALFWAAAMLLVAFLLKDADKKEAMLLLMPAIGATTFLAASQRGNKLDCAVCRWLGRDRQPE